MWTLAVVIAIGVGLSVIGNMGPQKSEEQLQEIEKKNKQGGTGYNVARGVFYASVIAIKKMGGLG